MKSQTLYGKFEKFLKWTGIKAPHESKSATESTELITTATKVNPLYPFEYNSSVSKSNKNPPKKEKTPFKAWSFGTINIRSGKEKDGGTKIYLITKEVASAADKKLNIDV